MPFDLLPLLQRLTPLVYGAYGTVVVECVYHHTIPGSGVYDPVTGNYTPDTVIDVEAVGVILTRYAAEEISDIVLATDVLGLLQASSLTFIPREEDSITIPVFPPLTTEVATWNVESVGRDAARLAWEVRLRKPGA